MTPELFKLIHRIRIETARLAKELLAGDYRSAFRGRGLEFNELREYQPGDEVRHIDWHASAHSDHLYVKTFREERELNIMLLVDISASLRFGTHRRLKSQLMVEVASILAFSALHNHDKVGLILFSDQVIKYIPPRQTLRDVMRIIRELLLNQPKGGATNPSAALHFLGQLQLKSAVCFLISDFICPDFSHEAALIVQQHDLIGIALTDPAEKGWPPLNLATIQDLESGRQETLSSPDHLEALTSERLAQHKKRMLCIGADFVELETDRPFLPTLQKFFKLRSRHS